MPAPGATAASADANDEDHPAGNMDSCVVCGVGGDILLCSECPRSFHARCAKLEKAPEGEWRCVRCGEETAQAARHSSGRHWPLPKRAAPRDAPAYENQDDDGFPVYDDDDDDDDEGDDGADRGDDGNDDDGDDDDDDQYHHHHHHQARRRRQRR